MEHAYVTFKTMVGQFDIGYQAADEWGTVFGDTPGSRPRAKYVGAFGPVNILAIYQKDYEADVVRLNAAAGGGLPSVSSTAMWTSTCSPGSTTGRAAPPVFCTCTPIRRSTGPPQTSRARSTPSPPT